MKCQWFLNKTIKIVPFFFISNISSVLGLEVRELQGELCKKKKIMKGKGLNLVTFVDKNLPELLRLIFGK